MFHSFGYAKVCCRCVCLSQVAYIIEAFNVIVGFCLPAYAFKIANRVHQSDWKDVCLVLLGLRNGYFGVLSYVFPN